MASHVDFQPQEELAALLEEIGLKLHAKNRIAGESAVVWHLAEAIRVVGQVTKRVAAESELNELYGDGYQTGILAGAAMRKHFLGMLAEEFAARK